MSSSLPAPPEEALRRFLDRDGELAYVVDPAPAVLEPLVDVLDASDATPDARLLVDADQLDDEVEDFLFASALADLTERGAVRVRTDTGFRNANLLLFPGAAVQVFDLEVRLGGVETEAADLVEALADAAEDRWVAADDFELRTPARSAIRDTLASQLGAEAESDFSAIVDSLETARGDGAGLDEVTIALLVAAKNEALLYDISKWGEDVGLASKATFSRTKSTLEELGLIATEKVPIDVGRPRLRLKFADERLREASPDELASVAQALMG
ncbi:MAG: transcriptional regulator TbsP [Halobacteriales archaeon]